MYGGERGEGWDLRLGSGDGPWMGLCTCILLQLNAPGQMYYLPFLFYMKFIALGEVVSGVEWDREAAGRVWQGDRVGSTGSARLTMTPCGKRRRGSLEGEPP